MRNPLVLIVSFGILCLRLSAQTIEAGWPEYGGTLAGQRYSESKQIDTRNVGRLTLAWTFHTHALQPASAANAKAAFEATPVLWNDTLYFDSPFDQVFAIDAATGKLKWTFDPKISRARLYIVTSRGVALWRSPSPAKGLCREASVLVATLDRRLIALDAASGKPCPAFGIKGEVDLTKNIEIDNPDLYFFTSPPIVVNGRIILGSSVADNQQVFAASGAVRAFDVVTGKQLWSWEPLPWAARDHPRRAGSANTWAPLAADAENDLVFLPTGSASLDYYGGSRPGDDRDANSIVALRASTGEKVWAFQLVHHDLWDYDTASQPLLFTFRGTIPALAITNKTGMIYVFNRLTGEPLYPIVERTVPGSDLIGEKASSTQPFSTLPPLLPLSIANADFVGTAQDRHFCAEQMGKLKYKGIFTPPSESGTLIFPAALGGPNWGSSAFDASSSIMYTRVNLLPFRLRMSFDRAALLTFSQRVERKWIHQVPFWLGGEQAAERAVRIEPDALMSNAYRPPDMGLAEKDESVMRGSPYSMLLQALVTPNGIPCAPEPFGRIVATNLQTGKQVWTIPHGHMAGGLNGSIGVGGPIVTAGGLVFAASTNDPYLWAYDAATGRELWRGRLPATANATPMTYQVHGHQYVIIAAGGHRLQSDDESDAILAFTLPGSPTHGPSGQSQSRTQAH